MQAGCLTSDQNARLHSCERGTECSGIKSHDVVWITPVITRTGKGVDVPELGAGGGGGDLDQVHELELNDTDAVGRLMNLCSTNIQDPKQLSKIISLLSTAMVSDRKTLSFGANFTLENDEDSISLLRLTEILSSVAEKKDNLQTSIDSMPVHGETRHTKPSRTEDKLPKSIVRDGTPIPEGDG